MVVDVTVTSICLTVDFEMWGSVLEGDTLYIHSDSQESVLRPSM